MVFFLLPVRKIGGLTGYKDVLIYEGHTEKWKRVAMLVPPVALVVIGVSSALFVYKKLRTYLAD